MRGNGRPFAVRRGGSRAAAAILPDESLPNSTVAAAGGDYNGQEVTGRPAAPERRRQAAAAVAGDPRRRRWGTDLPRVRATETETGTPSVVTRGRHSPLPSRLPVRLGCGARPAGRNTVGNGRAEGSRRPRGMGCRRNDRRWTRATTHDRFPAWSSRSDPPRHGGASRSVSRRHRLRTAGGTALAHARRAKGNLFIPQALARHSWPRRLGRSHHTQGCPRRRNP